MPQAIVFPEPRQVALQDVGLPGLEPGQVRLRTRVTLLSTGTEGTIYAQQFDPDTHWDRWFRLDDGPGATSSDSRGRRPGYSCVAEVEDSRDDGFRPGDRVVAQLGHASHHVTDADSCTAVPNNVSDEDAAWFALAKVAFVGAEASGVRLGSSALVIGAGPVGQMATRWLAAAGAGRLVVLDRASEPRLELARAGGATDLVHGAPTPDDLIRGDGDAGTDAEDRAFDVVVDATGNPQVFERALGIVVDGGRVVVLGDTGQPSEQRLSSDLIVRGLTVVGAHGNHIRGRREHDVRGLFFRLVASGRFPMAGLVTHRFAPRQCAEAYELIEHDRSRTMGLIFDWRSR